jgi:hypothetical protein
MSCSTVHSARIDPQAVGILEKKAAQQRLESESGFNVSAPASWDIILIKKIQHDVVPY